MAEFAARLSDSFVRKVERPTPCQDNAAVDSIYRAGAQGDPCWVRNHRGHVRALPMVRWIGGPDISPADRLADEGILRRCGPGPVLDVGCGPGRFTSALRRRGVAALGVDVSQTAIDLTRVRGGTAMRRDFFEPMPAEGHWAQILLADGNIGIGGDPGRLLQRAAQVLAPDGAVIAESESSAASRHEILRWETHRHIGRWFPWSHISTRALVEIAHAAGFNLIHVHEANSRRIVVLARHRRSHRRDSNSTHWGASAAE